MHTADALREVHERTHRSLSRLIAHCQDLGPDEVDREFAGFGYPTVRLQIHHVLGAERYWIGVLEGRIDADDDSDDYPTVASLEALRQSICAATDAYLAGASADELSTARPMTTWGGGERVLVPAHVVIRTLTHVYHHQGQAAAICRMLGRPFDGGDYPIAAD